MVLHAHIRRGVYNWYDGVAAYFREAHKLADFNRRAYSLVSGLMLMEAVHLQNAVPSRAGIACWFRDASPPRLHQ